MNIKLIKAFTTIALLLLLAACGQKITAGYVCSKEYSPCDMYTYFTHKCGTMIPYTVYIPESWEVEIYDYVDGQKVTATYSVSEEIYNTLHVGDWYNANE